MLSLCGCYTPNLYCKKIYVYLDLTNKPEKIFCGGADPTSKCVIFKATHICTTKVNIKYQFYKMLLFIRDALDIRPGGYAAR
jgi:hypothetical protein